MSLAATHVAAWFTAAVWPNLVASAIWGVPAGLGFVWHHRRIKAHISDELRRLHGPCHDQQRDGSETT